ncbi:hypothetical protein VQV48_003972 [Providencia rettgeri]|uniref:hypothetical protein n=1 Tax=Providencia sp. Me31A TaxID=3392637 RepID=UPI002AB32D44|nr:hypothetical protein [Providencia rettgeri]HEM8308177.1 hypothetical protein [Providencia rettgeri]
MKKLITLVLAITLSSFSIAETFEIKNYGNHEVTIGKDDFDGTMVRTILKLRSEKLKGSISDQYIHEIGYVCAHSTSDKKKMNIRSYYTTSHYVYGRNIGGTLGSTRSYAPIKIKFDDNDHIITVPLINKKDGLGWPELDLSAPNLIEKMKSSTIMRIKAQHGNSSKFDMKGAAAAFNAFYNSCN